MDRPHASIRLCAALPRAQRRWLEYWYHTHLQTVRVHLNALMLVCEVEAASELGRAGEEEEEEEGGAGSDQERGLAPYPFQTPFGPPHLASWGGALSGFCSRSCSRRMGGGRLALMRPLVPGRNISMHASLLLVVAYPVLQENLLPVW